jgi:hypothetical protein
MDKSEMKMLALAEKYYKPKTLAHAIRVAEYAMADFDLYKYDVDKIKSTVKDIWEAQNIKVDVRTMKVEENGAEVF